MNSVTKDGRTFARLFGALIASLSDIELACYFVPPTVTTPIYEEILSSFHDLLLLEHTSIFTHMLQSFEEKSVFLLRS